MPYQLTGCDVVPAHVRDSTVPSRQSWFLSRQHLAAGYSPHVPVASDVAAAGGGDEDDDDYQRAVGCDRTCSLEMRQRRAQTHTHTPWDKTSHENYSSCIS